MEQRLAAIDRQQARMLALLEALSEKVDNRIEDGDDWRKDVDRIIHGDGNGFRGVTLRLDRVERHQKEQKEAATARTKLVAIPLVALLVKALWELLVTP